MKLRQLQFAQAIAHSRSFSGAAEQCNATQPTLSNAISQLEEELGGKLFTRTTRKVDLTPFGRYILPYLGNVLDARSELEQAADAFHNPVQKLLRIGFSPLVDMKLLNRVLAPYLQRHPDISVFYKECLLDDLAGRLLNNVIDIAIVPENLQDGLFEQADFYQDALFYLPMDNGKQQMAAMQVKNLPDDAIIMTGGGCGLNGSLERLFKLHGKKLRGYPGQAISYQVIEEWAELGIGAGILPKAKLSMLNGRAVPLLVDDGVPATFNFEWIWNADTSSNAHIGELIEYIQNIIPILVDGEMEPVKSVAHFAG